MVFLINIMLYSVHFSTKFFKKFDSSTVKGLEEETSELSVKLRAMASRPHLIEIASISQQKALAVMNDADLISYLGK